jgi:hypothetical protein
VLSVEDEAIIVAFRSHALLPLDDGSGTELGAAISLATASAYVVVLVAT